MVLRDDGETAMLTIRIELKSFGIFKSKRFWYAEIENDATGTETRGNYRFRLYEKNSETAVWRGGEIRGFPRKTHSAFYLLYLCLKQIYERR
jgi:hypothetical protein